jgi:hypothetical protein
MDCFVATLLATTEERLVFIQRVGARPVLSWK